MNIWEYGLLFFSVFAGGVAALSSSGKNNNWNAPLLSFSGSFLLGLAIIHAISRHWNGRGFMLAVLYFLIFVMAWVIIPISLMGLLDTRFDFRGLNRRPDKPSDAEGDEE